MPSLPPGQVLDGKFRIVAMLAEGGLGHIYEAELPGSGKRVAVEVAPPDLGKNADSLGRFLQEVKAASGLNQEHIAIITDMGRSADGGPFLIASEAFRGQTLEARLASLGGRMPLGRAAHIARQILEALGPAHRAGLVHRGLGLRSIYLTHRGTDPDFVKVLDFGWHRVLGDDPNARQALAPLGVELPYFWAPEQARRQAIDGRADIFAVGAILYRLVTGQFPFQGADVATILGGVASGRYVPPRTVSPDVPPEVEQVLQYALALDPQYRYQTAEHLAQMLAPMAQPVAAPPPPEPQAAPPPPQVGGGTALPLDEDDLVPKRRGKGLPLGVGVALAAGMFGILMAARPSRPKAATTEPAKVEDKKEPAKTEPAKEEPKPVKEEPKKEEPKKEEPVAAATPDAATVAKAAPPDAAPVVEAKAGPPDAGTTTVAVKEPEKPKTVKLTVTISPPEAAAVARVTIDGKAVDGGSADVEAAGKPIKVEVRSTGYQTYSKKMDVPQDGALAIELKKAPPPPPIRKGPKPKL